MASRARVLKSRTVYQGRVVTLEVDHVVEPGRIDAVREVVRHPGSVVVLPRLADGRVVMVRQFRYAVGKRLWELVAGGVEPGERPLAAARRELIEETGYRARQFKLLLSFYPSPGFLSERMHLVEARHLRLAAAQPEPDERLEVRAFTPAELRRRVRARRIEDGKTLVGLLWLDLQEQRSLSRKRKRRAARGSSSLRPS